MPERKKEKGGTMGTKLNLCVGDHRIKADNFVISLEPRIIEIVKLMARRQAESDFEEAIKKNQH